MATLLVDPTDVKAVMETTLTAGEILPFAEDASLWVAEELASLSDARKEAVAKYLAAALVRLKDLGMTEVTFDEVQERYQVDPETTDYLLRAAGFDPTGRVADRFLERRAAGRKTAWRFGEGFDS